MRRCSLLALTFVVTMLVGAAAAQAVVVDVNAFGSGASVPFSSSDQSGYVGVALGPGTCGDLQSTGACASLANLDVPLVTSSGPCTDPALAPDLWVFGQTDRLPNDALCYHGGGVMHQGVMHQNETFALTWDAPFSNGSERNYPSWTRDYVEQFLRDVGDGSGTLTSPYAVTTQYSDGSGKAQNSSKYGGGCIDYGGVGGSQCEFGNPTGAGHDFPPSGCTPSGVSAISAEGTTSNTVCLTDSQIQSEVATMVAQTGIVGRTAGYTPTVVLPTPPGVDMCLDATGKLCSSNSSVVPPAPSAGVTGDGNIDTGNYLVELSYVTSSGESLPGPPTTVDVTEPDSAISILPPPEVNGVTGWYAYIATGNGSAYVRQGSSDGFNPTGVVLGDVQSTGAPPLPYFCSYHSQVEVGGTDVAYVVQPWTALTGCDEPDAPAIPANATPQQLGADTGIRLVSPLSQSHISAIVDPWMNGWFALDGAEMDDNGGCTPLSTVDTATVGSSAQNPYLLQHEFNNAGALSSDPNTYGGCAPKVLLSPAFVVPSSINQGDEVELDGSATASTLIVPGSDYSWDFGDGTPRATGPSVLHTYAEGGTYTVKLTVTDRGGNTASLSEAIAVLNQNGQPVVETGTPVSSSGGSAGSSGPGGGGASTPPALQVHLLLMPQALTAALRSGIAVRVSTNQAVDGFAYVSITRSLARRLRIRAGRGPSVTIGQGTVSRLKDGSATLHLHLSRSVVNKLKKLRHVTLTVRLALVSATGNKLAVVAAAHY